MESTVAQKLDALLKLQEIDSKLNDIVKIRGALPEEVSDLEDEIAGYETRLGKFETEIAEYNAEIDNLKQGIKDSEKLIKKYQEQQMNVRNNREYDAITKEIELQNLEIQIFEKKIKETRIKIETKNEDVEKTKNSLKDRSGDLEAKKQELSVITSESEEEEKKLLQDREKASNKIEKRLVDSYNKIRMNAANGLAVVKVQRGACGGCFNIVPPQRQAEIRERKKVTVCEHCGRVLADVEDVVIEEDTKKKRK
jgi:predicted  nucleic acid-binding Zn-ribbon protein